MVVVDCWFSCQLLVAIEIHDQKFFLFFFWVLVLVLVLVLLVLKFLVLLIR